MPFGINLRRKRDKENEYGMRKEEKEEFVPFYIKHLKGIILLVILILAAISSVPLCLYYVDIGQVGITYNVFTGVIDPMPNGGPMFHFKLPWQGVKYIFIATEMVDMWTDFDKETGKAIQSGDWVALDVPSSEGLVLYMDATTRWHIIGSEAKNLILSFPDVESYKDKVVLPAIREVVREATGKHSALDLYGPMRDVISANIKEKLRDRLWSDQAIPKTIVLEDFYMRKVWLPVDFSKSVESKQIAEQNLKKAEFERQTRLVQANATAQAMIIEAQGMAEAVRLVQERFKYLSPQESQAYLTYLYIQALQQGFIQGNKVIIFLPSEGGMPFILQLPKPEEL